MKLKTIPTLIAGMLVSGGFAVMQAAETTMPPAACDQQCAGEGFANQGRGQGKGKGQGLRRGPRDGSGHGQGEQQRQRRRDGGGNGPGQGA
jgi:hypothetical protein